MIQLGRLKSCAVLVTLACLASSEPGGADPLGFLQSLKDVPVAFAYGAATSPDGRHLYVAGDNAVSAFARDPGTGTLTYLETYREAKDGVSGLWSAVSVAVSPDGRHVYVASQRGSASGGAVAVFERDATAGTLRWLQAVPSTEVYGFEDYAILVSPDGRHVYVSNSNSDASYYYANQVLMVYERDESTGFLSYAETQVSGPEPFDSRLQLLAGLAMSPDGRHLYGASYFGGLVVFARDAATGGLSFVAADYESENGVTCLDGALSASVSPDGGHVYVASSGYQTGAGGIATFTRDGATGELSFGGCLPESGFAGFSSPAALTVSGDGRHVYVASMGDSNAGEDGAVLALARDPTTGSLSFVELLTEGEDGVDSLYDVVLSPDDRFLYTVSLGATTGVFGRDSASGSLSFVEAARYQPIDEVDGLRQPWAVEVSPDGRDVYVAGRSSDAVSHFARGDFGILSFRGAWFDGIDGVEGLGGVKDLAVSPDGRHVYALSSRLVVFARSAADGELTYSEAIDLGGSPYDLALSPDGQFLYLILNSDTAVFRFSRDAATGSVSLVDRIGTGPSYGLRTLAISPDGRFLYAGGFDSLTAIALDAKSAKIAFPKGPVLSQTLALAVSPDGRHVVAGVRYFDLETIDAILVFAADEEDGTLSILEGHQDGVDGVEGLARPLSIVFSPDGERVYVAGHEDHAIAVFARDLESGHLEFLRAHVDGEAGVDGLLGPQALAVSPDGENLYAASGWEHAITALGMHQPCVPGPQTMCLNGGRFKVEVEWLNSAGESGMGRVVPGAPAEDSGLFWFFSPANWEMLVKVLDGCAISDHFWVFAGATTDVAYTLRVSDSLTGQSKSYTNPLGNAAGAITDTSALAVCQ